MEGKEVDFNRHMVLYNPNYQCDENFILEAAMPPCHSLTQRYYYYYYYYYLTSLVVVVHVEIR
jgi:hypothetical protein